MNPEGTKVWVQDAGVQIQQAQQAGGSLGEHLLQSSPAHLQDIKTSELRTSGTTRRNELPKRRARPSAATLEETLPAPQSQGQSVGGRRQH